MPRLTPFSGILLLGPFLLCFILFWLIPIIWAGNMSLHSNTAEDPYNFDKEPVYEYVGLENYKSVLENPLFKKALQNTALYTVFSIGIIVPLAFLLAHIIRQTNKRVQHVFTFCLLLPGLTPPAVLSILFLLFFHGDQGILNRILVIPFGQEPINWIHDPKFIQTSLVIQSVWRWTGFVAFFFLCGMDALPKSYNESAQIEGAGPFKTLFHITLPLVRHIILFAVIFLFVDAFSMFSGAYSLLGGSGGPDNAGLLLVTHIYYTAFGKGHFADAAAISLIIAPVMLFIIGLLVLKSSKRGREFPEPS